MRSPDPARVPHVAVPRAPSPATPSIDIAQGGPAADIPMVDAVVVGGGINGAGIARDLAGRGAKVLLCEKDDLAQHTSS